MSLDNEISQFDAMRIVEAYKVGVVPPCRLRELSIGRGLWLDSINDDLGHIAKGGSKVRFLAAPWGGGKTHFLLMLQENALKLNFIISYVELHSRDAPLDRFEVVFQRVIRGLTLPNGGTLESMLDSWASTFPYHSADEIGAELSRLSPSLDFRAALRACIMHSQGDLLMHREVLSNVAGWLQGDTVSPALKRMGVRNSIKITNVTEILGSFLIFIAQNYAGLVIMLDEAEAVTSLTQSKRRDDANQNIRKLLDNTDAHKGMYILFATTPKFLQDPDRGAKSYPALWTRIRNVVSYELEMVSKRSPIIYLRPLNSEELKELAVKVVDIHSKAYEWDAFDYLNYQDIEVFMKKFTDTSANKSIRSFAEYRL